MLQNNILYNLMFAVPKQYISLSTDIIVRLFFFLTIAHDVRSPFAHKSSLDGIGQCLLHQAITNQCSSFALRSV